MEKFYIYTYYKTKYNTKQFATYDEALAASIGSNKPVKCSGVTQNLKTASKYEYVEA